MQELEKVNKITGEPEPAEEAQPQEAVELQVTWLFLQVVLCIIAITAVVALKQFAPDIYQNIKVDYSSLINQTLLLKDGDFSILHEE